MEGLHDMTNEFDGLVILGFASAAILVRGALHCGRALAIGPWRPSPKLQAPPPIGEAAGSPASPAGPEERG